MSVHAFTHLEKGARQVSVAPFYLFSTDSHLASFSYVRDGLFSSPIELQGFPASLRHVNMADGGG